MLSWLFHHGIFVRTLLAIVPLSFAAGFGPIRAADDDLAFYTSILSNSNIEIEVRANAVTRMLRLGGDLPERTVAEMLGTGDQQVVEAIALALVEGGIPNPPIAEALIMVLAETTPENGALIGITLARLGEPALESILEQYAAQSPTSGGRTALIRALAGFESRLAVDSLVRILQEPTSSDELAAALLGLREITRLELGTAVSSWVGWWSAVGDMPLEQAIGALTRDREQRLQEQDEQIKSLEKRNDVIGERLQQVLADWFITLPESEREPAVWRLLEEDLSHVRMFAGLQVQRMLRNGLTPQPKTVERIMRLLDDEESSLRILAAQLAAAMRVEGLGERLALKIEVEQDPQVVSMLIEQVVLNPSSHAFEPVLKRLNDPVAAQSSARALARLVDAQMVPEDWASQSLESIRILHETHRIPASSALLVLAGAPDDLERALLDLDDDSPALRRASANAFVSRGYFEGVLARSNDPAIRPAAILAFKTMEPSEDSLDRILSLTPSEAELVQWRFALEVHAARFPVDQKIEVDDLLSKDSRVPRQLRLDILSAARASINEQEVPELHLAMIDRETELLVEESRWQDVTDALFGLDCADQEPIRIRLFLAKIRLGDFEGAELVESTPQPWINLLDGTIKVAPAEAGVIATEIEQRFGEQLNSDQRERLDSIARTLAVASGDAGGLDD